MLRPLESLSLGIAALLTAAGLLVAALPAAHQPVAERMPLTLDPPCPYEADLLVSDA